MSDRYNWNDERAEFEAAEAEHLRMRAEEAAREAERISAWEDMPLRLTKAQRIRLWIVLRDELGPSLGVRILKKIETDV